ncbi:universal stress protein [Pseudofrankia saprophytica]|uniref:universal stress protein n=1 Tax=Pseudofrankia saprophytica TaxID=298655 RepID=UPI000234D7CB|nr:universal stress protein [Pseudofrankia saprophytica]
MRTEIVVGVDASPGSAAALAWALDDASRRGVRVRAVLAWADDSRPAEVDAIATSPGLEDLAAAADKVLRRLVAAARYASTGGDRLRLSGAQVPVDERTVYSTAAHALLQESFDAGLLVIGAEPRAATRWALAGPVGDACAHEAPIPLVVVPPDAGTARSRHRAGKPVLVGVDGSRASAIAARWAAGEAALRRVPLRVLHVAAVRGTAPAQSRVPMTIPVINRTSALPWAPVGAVAATGRGGRGGGWAPVAAARTHAVLDPVDSVRRVVAGVRTMPGAPPVEPMSVAGGAAATLLLEAAGDAQLLVLGARGAGGFPALSLGSTAHQCLARVSCPTAIIRGHG